MKDFRDATNNVPKDLTGESSHFRYNILTRRLTDLAADASEYKESYS